MVTIVPFSILVLQSLTTAFREVHTHFFPGSINLLLSHHEPYLRNDSNIILSNDIFLTLCACVGFPTRCLHKTRENSFPCGKQKIHGSVFRACEAIAFFEVFLASWWFHFLHCVALFKRRQRIKKKDSGKAMKKPWKDSHSWSLKILQPSGCLKKCRCLLCNWQRIEKSVLCKMSMSHSRDLQGATGGLQKVTKIHCSDGVKMLQGKILSWVR